MKLIEIPRLLFDEFKSGKEKEVHPDHRGIRLVAEIKGGDSLQMVFEDDRPHPADHLRQKQFTRHADLLLLPEGQSWESQTFHNRAFCIGVSGDYQNFVEGHDEDLLFSFSVRNLEQFQPDYSKYPIILRLLQRAHELSKEAEVGPFKVAELSL